MKKPQTTILSAMNYSGAPMSLLHCVKCVLGVLVAAIKSKHQSSCSALPGKLMRRYHEVIIASVQWTTERSGDPLSRPLSTDKVSSLPLSQKAERLFYSSQHKQTHASCSPASPRCRAPLKRSDCCCHNRSSLLIRYWIVTAGGVLIGPARRCPAEGPRQLER